MYEPVIKIEESAFEGIKVRIVVIQESIKTISNNALNDKKVLEIVYYK